MRVWGWDVGVWGVRSEVWGGRVWGGGAWGCDVVHTLKSQHSEEGMYLQFEVILDYLVRQITKTRESGVKKVDAPVR